MVNKFNHSTGDIIKIPLPEMYLEQIDKVKSYNPRNNTARNLYIEKGFYRTETEYEGFDFRDLKSYIDHGIRKYDFRLYNESDISIVTSWPGQSYAKHTDEMYVVHVPVITNNKCYMYIGNHLYHLEYGYFYITNTRKEHSSFNLGNEPRIHILLSAKDHT